MNACLNAGVEATEQTLRRVDSCTHTERQFYLCLGPLHRQADRLLPACLSAISNILDGKQGVRVLQGILLVLGSHRLAVSN